LPISRQTPTGLLAIPSVSAQDESTTDHLPASRASTVKAYRSDKRPEVRWPVARRHVVDREQ
jgi:hypothetical protein